MKRAIKGYPGLYREEYSTGGLRFRILINYNKKIIQEYFYVTAKSTEAKTKKLAVARWRKLREKYPVITKRKFREIPRNVSSSRIIGVTRITHEVKGYEYEFWKAAWTTLRGKKCSRVFSVNKYGERKAKKLAIETRKEALDKIGAE